jgi:hypothetical protein
MPRVGELCWFRGPIGNYCRVTVDELLPPTLVRVKAVDSDGREVHSQLVNITWLSPVSIVERIGDLA